MTFTEYQQAVENLPYGKRLPTARYVFTDSDHPLPEPLATLVSAMRQKFAPDGQHNLVKFHTQSFKISLLHYPRFFEEAHPALAEAIVADLLAGQAKKLKYSGNDNPPILHRKETMLPQNHTRAAEFAELSAAEEAYGLYIETSRIGFKSNWEKLIQEKGLTYHGHRLVQASKAAIKAEEEKLVTVHRHRTALVRYELSRPVRMLMELGLLHHDLTFFDYGCGHGADVQLVREMGIIADGWDPVHAQAESKKKADVVNLGYVLNVIEDPAERTETLIDAWHHANRILIVSTMVAGQESYTTTTREFGDGILTKRNTFQRHFEQSELQFLIEECLGHEADAINVGIFVVFRDPTERQTFLLRRIRRRRALNFATIPRLRLAESTSERHTRLELLADRNREQLDLLWQRTMELGRYPSSEEFEPLKTLLQAVGSKRTLDRLCAAFFNTEALSSARNRRIEDVLVYLARAHFRGKPKLKELEAALKEDVRVLFGSFAAANQQARELLFAVGKAENIQQLAEEREFGCNEPEHFTLHESLLDDLPPVLRIYVQCASLLYGDPHQADLIKIHKKSGKVSLLFFDGFLEKQVPELRSRVKISLRTRRVQVFSYATPENRQFLIFKDRYLANTHSAYKEAKRFSRKLQMLGLEPEDWPHGMTPVQMKELAGRINSKP
jgi:DNA phosphorothioation-associated putative methyltransferase